MGDANIKLRLALTAKNLNYVGQRGSSNARVLCVGEAPGADEDAKGFPFVGYSGQLLDVLLNEAGFKPDEVRFTNPYKTRPPDNDITRIEELGIPKELYENEFFEELEETKPTIIIALGKTPLQILCPFTVFRGDDDTKIGRWRGSLLSSPRLSWPHYVIPAYHPAFILREYSERDTNVLCLSRACEEYRYYEQQGHLNPLPEREFIVEPTYDVAFQYLSECLEQKDALSVDIEMYRRKIPYCISFAKSPTSAISVCFFDYDDTHGVSLYHIMDKLLRTKAQIGQNYTSFDCHWLEWMGFVPNLSLVDDTRIRHNMLWPELRHKLEFQCMQYTREPFYKEEGSGWSPKSGRARMMKYNCKDTTVTYEIYQRQEEEFDERPKLREYYYRHELPLARAMHRIEQRGLLMDTTQLSSLRKFIENELDSSCSRIGKSVNKPCYSGAKTAARAGYKKPGTYLNTGSPKQIADLLTSIGLKLPKNRGTGNVTTNEEALNRLYAESGNNILKELLLTRETSKLLNTYVNQELKNDISYTCYLVGGTVSGRRASAASPLGNGKRNLGTNHQNIPKHYELAERLRCCYISRPNYIFVMCDQVGAEDWIIQGLIADLTGDTRGLQELRDNIDRHQKLASIIFGVPLDQCSKSAHTNFRYIGKRVRYAGSYGMGASKFSAVLAKEGFAVSETDCDFLLRKFHEAEPSVKQVFQQYIEHTITKERRLDNLFGRKRQVFGLHPHRDNSKIFRELYSYIPQGTVGDNTGEAVLMVDAESTPRCYCVAEIHDAIALEVFDEDNDVFKACNLLQRSFDRKIRFPKGLELTIPIEFEIGYNLQDTVKFSKQSEALEKLHVYKDSRRKDKSILVTS